MWLNSSHSYPPEQRKSVLPKLFLRMTPISLAWPLTPNPQLQSPGPCSCPSLPACIFPLPPGAAGPTAPFPTSPVAPEPQLLLEWSTKPGFPLLPQAARPEHNLCGEGEGRKWASCCRLGAPRPTALFPWAQRPSR